jgi:hypothetical protein
MNSFTIPMELTGLNEFINAERRNKFIGAKIKKDSSNIAMLCCKKLELKQNTQYDLIINWYTKDKKKDSDNIFFSVKFILDGVIAAKKIEGDGYKYIRHIHNNRYIGQSKIEVIFLEVQND